MPEKLSDTPQWEKWLADTFSYKNPTAKQIEQYQEIRAAAKAFATVLVDNCPPGADKTVVLRKVNDLVMLANKSIATRGVNIPH